jgi:GH15 family glucan-1,4-alpha-glucosidase
MNIGNGRAVRGMILGLLCLAASGRLGAAEESIAIAPELQAELGRIDCLARPDGSIVRLGDEALVTRPGLKRAGFDFAPDGRLVYVENLRPVETERLGEILAGLLERPGSGNPLESAARETLHDAVNAPLARVADSSASALKEDSAGARSILQAAWERSASAASAVSVPAGAPRAARPSPARAEIPAGPGPARTVPAPGFTPSPRRGLNALTTAVEAVERTQPRDAAEFSKAAACAAAGCPPLPPEDSDARSFAKLTTGNGHGFQLFDTSSHRLIAFLEHPYRFLRPPEGVPPPEGERKADGPQRRNLLEEFSLGLASGGEIEWMDAWRSGESRYARQTNVIEWDAKGGKSELQSYFYAPFGLENNAMLALVRARPSDAGPPAPVSGAARLKFRLGATPPPEIEHADDVVKIPGERLQRLDGAPTAWVQTGRGEGAMIYLPVSAGASLDCRASGDGALAPDPEVPGDPPTVCVGAQVDEELRLPAPDGWFGVMVAYVDDPKRVPETAAALRSWLAGRTPREMLDQSLAEWEAWRKPPRARFRGEAEREVWRQQEAVLRMAQIREPNFRDGGKFRVNNGMILASLPPGNWAISWVRDASYATGALARMGHYDEARKSLDFFLNAEAGKFKRYVSGADYRISLTRYYGTGEEENDYSGTKGPNIEMDDWGLFLWAERQYLDASGDKAWLKKKTRQGTVYEATLHGVAEAIAKNLEAAPKGGLIMKRDSSIWESNEDVKHYAFTTLMAARGLADFSMIARAAGRLSDARKYAKLAARVELGFRRAFTDPKQGVIGDLESAKTGYVDSSVIEALNMGEIGGNDNPLAQRTLQTLRQLKLPSGGYRRTGGSDPYQYNEWAFINLRVATALYRAGRPGEAGALIARTVRKAGANFGLIPEEYFAPAPNGLPPQHRGDAPLGSYTGAIPMVGYGSGAYVLTLLARDGLLAPGAAPSR